MAMNDDCKDELRDILIECNYSFQDHPLGKLGVIPFNRWENCSFSKLHDFVRVLQRQDKYDFEARKAAILYGLPDCLRMRLLSPCEKSSPIPNMKVEEARYTDQYSLDNPFQPLKDACHVVTRNTILGVMAYGIHVFLSDTLSNRQNAVETLYYPGDPSIRLPLRSRLALGVVREAIILHHFESLNEFWICHDRIRRKGHRRALYSYDDCLINRPLVEAHLSSDKRAMAMYEVMMEIGFMQNRLQELNWES